MSIRGVNVDHATIQRWVFKFTPLLEKEFSKRKKVVGKRWRMDETYVKVKGQWRYLYRAVDKQGNTVDFLLTKRRQRISAQSFLIKAIENNGKPELINAGKEPRSLCVVPPLFSYALGVHPPSPNALPRPRQAITRPLLGHRFHHLVAHAYFAAPFALGFGGPFVGGV